MSERRGRKGRSLPGLTAARERAFLSQAELARRAGLTQATIWSLETGGYRSGGAYGSTIRKLAAALDVDPEVLVTEPDREEMLTT